MPEVESPDEANPSSSPLSPARPGTKTRQESSAAVQTIGAAAVLAKFLDL